MTVDEVLEAIRPALREILTPHELASTTTRVTWAADWSRGLSGNRQELIGTDLLRPEALVEVRTLGEFMGLWVTGTETAAEVYERARSDLQDFVAESRFGWGQWRP